MSCIENRSVGIAHPANLPTWLLKGSPPRVWAGEVLEPKEENNAPS